MGKGAKVGPELKRTRRERAVLAASSLICLVLIPVQLGWLPGLRRAWGFTLWQYLPPPAVALLAAALVALAWPGFRGGLVRIVVRFSERAPRGCMVWCAVGLAAALWLLRERHLFADSYALLAAAALGVQFLFPDVGATFLFGVAHRLATFLGISPESAVQLFVCAAGVAATLCFLRVGRSLAPTPRLTALAAALVLCGGLARLFFGHVEVYAFVVLCAAIYFLAACAYLEDRGGYAVAGLALGAGIWMHLSFIFLIPSFLALPLLVGHARGRSRGLVHLWAAGSAAAAAPLLIFLLAMLATGHQADLERAWTTMVQWGGIEPNPSNHEAFLRGWGAEPGEGTRYVIYSWPHLKYLVNAAFVLAPAALPVLVAMAAFRPRSFIGSPLARFLSIACASMLLYSSVVRPVWGPYDWDLFSLTAVCLSALAALLFLRELAEHLRSQLGVLWIGASVIAVTIPLVVIGVAPGRGEGLFSKDLAPRARAESYIRQIERRIEPWL